VLVTKGFGYSIQAVEAIHACGLQHNEIQELNVRLDRVAKKAWVVNFAFATEHECTHQPVILSGLEPEAWSFGCMELFKVALATSIWFSPSE
jgi:hypothetical protein